MPTQNELPVVTISMAKQSSVTFGDAFAFGPKNAFDNSLDTAVETKEQDKPYFEFTFAKPMTIGTVVQPDSNHLTGIRVYNRHREPGTNSFTQGLFMELYNEEGKMIRFSKEKRVANFYLFNIAGMPNTVSRVKFYKTVRATLTFSEIQIYSDHMCRHARALILKTSLPTSKPKLPTVFKVATKIKHHCPTTRALSISAAFQYSFCGTVDTVTCAAFALSNVVLDASFLATMHRMECGVTAVGPELPALSERQDNAKLRRYFKTSWCAETSGGSRCAPLQELVNLVGRSDGSLVYVEMTAQDWTRTDSLLNVAAEFAAERLFIPLRVNQETIDSPNVLSNLYLLTAKYDIYAYHVNMDAGSFKHHDATYPMEIQLSMIQKSQRRVVTSGINGANNAAVDDEVQPLHLPLDRWLKQWGVDNLTRATLPLPAKAVVPFRSFSAARRRVLSKEAEEAFDTWTNNDVELELVRLDFAECDWLAEAVAKDVPLLAPRMPEITDDRVKSALCRLSRSISSAAWQRRQRRGEQPTTSAPVA
jgi:hypothetical protein